MQIRYDIIKKEVLILEMQKIQLQKAKTWNMVSLVMKALGLIFTVSGLFLTLKGTATTLVKVYSVIAAIISIIILAMYFKNNQNLKNETHALKTPYYLYLIWMVVTIVYNIIASSSMKGFEPTGAAGIDVSKIMMASLVIVIIGRLIAALPAVITLVHLFKADTKE